MPINFQLHSDAADRPQMKIVTAEVNCCAVATAKENCCAVAKIVVPFKTALNFNLHICFLSIGFAWINLVALGFAWINLGSHRSPGIIPGQSKFDKAAMLSHSTLTRVVQGGG